MAKDYYKILGITDEEKKLKGDEFNALVKKKFKKLSLQWHPDRCRDDSKKQEYEEKFKEIAEAYKVLTEKRDEYDNPMNGGFDFSGFGGFGGMNIHDIMRNFGFGGFGSQQETVQKGSSIRVGMVFTLEELFNGVEKTIKYKRNDTCSTCGGSGRGPHTKEEQCPICNGTGFHVSHRGGWQQITTCPNCNGSGKILKNPCPSCGGSGLVTVEHEETITIPKGGFDGMSISYNGAGNACKDGINGDLIVVIREAEHERFVRDGHDLICDIHVKVLDAILGCETTVETIDNKTLKVKIPQGVTDGTKIKFRGNGMPVYGRNGVRGDMIGIIIIDMPNSLTDREIELINNLKEEKNFK